MLNSFSSKSKHMYAKGLSNLGSGAMKLSQLSSAAKTIGNIAGQTSNLIDPSTYKGSAGQVLDTGIERAKKIQKELKKVSNIAKLGF